MKSVVRLVLVMVAITVAAFALDSCISIHVAEGDIDHPQGRRTTIEKHVGVTDDSVDLDKNQKGEK